MPPAATRKRARNAKPAVKVLSEDAIERPQEDRRGYRLVELANRMQVLLISDPTMDPELAPKMDDEDEESGEDEVSASDDGEDDGEADGEDDDDDDGDAEGAAAKKAAVALSLGVGSLSDPKELQGCAHFVEHMLFLGNKKFPGENEWATFLSDHGGEDNGETSWETTTFYFDVEPKYLKPALERFAAFFVAPTFDFDASEREVKAIESEFQQAKHRDGDRVSQLRCHLCADGHPHKGFGWGDARSLVDQPAAAGVDVRAEMHKFHESHYSANLMTAVVVGFEGLDELQALAVDTLAPISDRDVVRPAFSAAPAPPPPVALPRVVRVVPQKKARTLELSGRCRRCGRTCAPSLRSTSSTCSATRGRGRPSRCSKRAGSPPRSTRAPRTTRRRARSPSSPSRSSSPRRDSPTSMASSASSSAPSDPSRAARPSGGCTTRCS